MKEIEVKGNKYGIEKIFISEEEPKNNNSIELIVNIPEDPKGEKLAENILFQQDMAISEGSYEPDSFNVKLPIENHIKMTGDIKNIVDFLKTINILNMSIIQILEKHIKPLSFQRKPTVSDFFSDDEPNVEDKVRQLICSFQPEDRPKALNLLELAGKLNPEIIRAIQRSFSLQASGRSSDTPTRDAK